MNAEPREWVSCWADVYSSGYGTVATAFLEKVVEPSLTSIDEQISHWESGFKPEHMFHADAITTLRRATTSAFALSLQSLWERQFRAYLRSCALNLPDAGPDAVARSEASLWTKLERLFIDLRHVKVSDFEAWPVLELLNTVGNACRHGDGPSAKRLMVEKPEWWPQPRPGFPPPPENPGYTPHPPTFNNATVPREVLRDFADAIVLFWAEIKYHHDLPLFQKHNDPNIGAWLRKEDLARAARQAKQEAAK
jgi:hypothetical protein